MCLSCVCYGIEEQWHRSEFLSKIPSLSHSRQRCLNELPMRSFATLTSTESRPQLMTTPRRSLWLLLFGTMIVVVIGAPCPAPGPVATDVHAVDCSDLQLNVVADNVTLIIENATGTINITSDRPGTLLQILDSTVVGSITLNGSHTSATVRGSTINGTDILLCYGSLNVTIIIVESTVTGTNIASIFANAVGASIFVANSSLIATQFAASVVGTSLNRIVVSVSNSTLRVNGTNNVGIAALAAGSVVAATVNVVGSAIFLSAGNTVGILGTGKDFPSSVSWTNVTISASRTNITSNAGNFVGILGVGSQQTVAWTDVLIAAAFLWVKSNAGSRVGILGAGSQMPVTWTRVSVRPVTFSSIASTAAYAVGVMGAGCVNTGVVWTQVSITAVTTNLSTVGDNTGIIGAGSQNFVTWSNVSLSATDVTVSTGSGLSVGVLGAGCGKSVVWVNVVIVANRVDVAMVNTIWYIGVVGSGSNDGVVWANVTISASHSNVVSSTAREFLGIIGAGSENGVSWTNVLVTAVVTNITLTSWSYVGVLGASTHTRGVNWTNTNVSVVDSYVTSTTRSFVGVLGAASGAAVAGSSMTARATTLWVDVTVVLVGSALACRQTGAVAGILGAGFATRDTAASYQTINRSDAVWQRCGGVARVKRVGVGLGPRWDPWVEHRRFGLGCSVCGRHWWIPVVCSNRYAGVHLGRAWNLDKLDARECLVGYRRQ